MYYSIIIVLIWFYLLFVFRKTKLDFFKFIFGSIGFFLIVFLLFRGILVPPIIKGTTYLVGLIGDLTGFWKGYHNYGILFINNLDETISLNIDYECSGFIELLIYFSLVLFYPLYNIFEKTKHIILGFLYIVFANIVRLSFISLSVYLYGNSAYYISHAILGRLIFFAFILYLYYAVFTKPQIKKQKVGNFDY